MNGSRRFISEVARALESFSFPIGVDVVLLPPNIYLEQVAELGERYGLDCGAQNIYLEESGPYTGEISAEMVKDIGGEWVLIGHSERRKVFFEKDNMLAKKFESALKAGLAPILCIGESLEERNEGKAVSVVKEQLNTVAKQVGPDFCRATIAYEPVWAIGTNEAASPGQVAEMHGIIREELRNIDAQNCDNQRVLYGGSMQRQNASGLLSIPEVDGGLIGGASLKMEEFLGIVTLANE